MTCNCPQSAMTDQGYTSFCGLPARKDGSTTNTPFPDPCPTDACDVVLLPAPDLTPDCKPTCVSPCTEPVPEPKDCDWSAEQVSSLPPALGCPPVNVGFGQYDGGFKYWGGEKDPSILMACWEGIRNKYSQWDWHHILDLQQSKDWYSNLMVRRNGIVEDISEMEFITLAVRMATLAQVLGAAPVTFDPAKLGLSVVQTGADANGVPTFSLAATYNGQTVGMAMPLMAHWDATGEPIGLTFPASLLPNLTVTP